MKIPDVEDLKLRPIIAGPSCQTHRLSNLLDIQLQPLAKHVKIFLRDSTDFLNSLPETVKPESIFVSFDVESLYSNSPHSLGLEAIKHWLQKHPEEIHPRFKHQFILEAE